jgi:hypothetical protein
VCVAYIDYDRAKVTFLDRIMVMMTQQGPAHD